MLPVTHVEMNILQAITQKHLLSGPEYKCSIKVPQNLFYITKRGPSRLSVHLSACLCTVLTVWSLTAWLNYKKETGENDVLPFYLDGF